MKTTKTQQLLDVLKKDSVATREEVVRIFGRTPHAYVRSLINQGHSIRTLYSGKRIMAYYYDGYRKPFNIIVEDIDNNYPILKKSIRAVYFLLTTKVW